MSTATSTYAKDFRPPVTLASAAAMSTRQPFWMQLIPKDQQAHYSHKTSSEPYVYHVDQDKLHEVISEAENCLFFDIAVRKQWTAINSSSISATLYEGPSKPVSLSDKYLHMLNTRGAACLYGILRCVKMVGYAAVSYTMDEELGMVIPVIIPLNHYTLWWEYEPSGRRRYFITPFDLPAPMSETTIPAEGGDLRKFADVLQPPQNIMHYGTQMTGSQRMVSAGSMFGINPISTWQPYESSTFFEHATVFVYNDPLDNGVVVSETQKCLANILQVKQTMHDWMLANNNKTNPPFIIDTNLARAGMTNSGKTRPCIGYFGAGLNTEGTAGEGSSNLRKDDSIDNRELDLENTAMGRMSTNLNRYAETQIHMARVSSSINANAFNRASTKAQHLPLRVFDEMSGHVQLCPASRPWEHANIYLPPGSGVAKVDLPEPTKSMPNMLNVWISMIFASYNVPMSEVMLTSNVSGAKSGTVSGAGSATAGANMGASDAADSHFKATINWYRSQFASNLQTMYWEINREHWKEIIRGTARDAKLEVDESKVENTLRFTRVEFSFRDPPPTFNTKLAFYNARVVSWDYVRRALGEHYGLRDEDICKVGPLEQAEQHEADMAEMQHKFELESLQQKQKLEGSKKKKKKNGSGGSGGGGSAKKKKKK